MRAYRLSRPEHASTALEGIGARLYPGRWNRKGVAMVYLGEHVSLAMLEVLVHMNWADVPAGHRLQTFELPEGEIYRLPESDWPEGWNELPYRDTVREAGSRFVSEGRYLAMAVPSAIAPGECNLLLNPLHPAIARVVLVSDQALSFDDRLLK